jgi:hypothetical protein
VRLRSPDDGWKEAPGLRIEPMTEAHAGAGLAIYQAGIDEGDATFGRWAGASASAGITAAGGTPFSSSGAAGQI